eukprot:196832-Prorocentrum_minimum.AAC.1
MAEGGSGAPSRYGSGWDGHVTCRRPAPWGFQGKISTLEDDWLLRRSLDKRPGAASERFV